MSLHVGDVPTSTDVLIVGSGFEGAVVAAKLAERNIEVCVVERGKAYPPGSFPRAPGEFAANFWDPSGGRPG